MAAVISMRRGREASSVRLARRQAGAGTGAAGLNEMMRP